MSNTNAEPCLGRFLEKVMELLSSGSRRLVAGLILVLAPAAFACADEMEGTWRLVMRKLPDGTVQTPPTVQGVFTIKNGVEQTIVYWTTPEGKPASLSQIDKFELSDTQVSATAVLVIFDDGSGKPPKYTIGGETKRLPVTRQGGRISYQHPTHPPFVVREGNKLTATLEGAFADYWEKLE
jgi:hypothetical protein